MLWFAVHVATYDLMDVLTSDCTSFARATTFPLVEKSFERHVLSCDASRLCDRCGGVRDETDHQDNGNATGGHVAAPLYGRLRNVHLCQVRLPSAVFCQDFCLMAFGQLSFFATV